MDGEAPNLTVSSKCRPLVAVNVAGSEGLLDIYIYIYIAFEIPLARSSKNSRPAVDQKL